MPLRFYKDTSLFVSNVFMVSYGCSWGPRMISMGLCIHHVWCLYTHTIHNNTITLSLSQPRFTNFSTASLYIYNCASEYLPCQLYSPTCVFLSASPQATTLNDHANPSLYPPHINALYRPRMRATHSFVTWHFFILIFHACSSRESPMQATHDKSPCRFLWWRLMLTQCQSCAGPIRIPYVNNQLPTLMQAI